RVGTSHTMGSVPARLARIPSDPGCLLLWGACATSRGA
ncbi:hypothetical protein IOCL1545_000031200, partial [Leishmania shawi]